MDSRTCVLLVQLGTPDAPTAPAVRRYLREFLSDPRVVDLPRWLWLPILYGPVLTFRPRKTAALYRNVWTDDGSPLAFYTERLADRLREVLPVPVAVGMRYGNPSLAQRLRSLRGKSRVILVPLFPQYAEATTGSVVARAEEIFAGSSTELVVVPPVFEEPSYVDALATRIEEAVEEHGEPERWLVSFHGIPMSQVRRGDPYPAHCERTAALLAQRLGWPADRWKMVYQSRFGPAAWLTPATDKELEALGAQKLGSLGVVCPGFAADCLETIDEIADLGREQFQEAGGGRMFTVSCLNDHPAWVQSLAGAIADKL